MNVENETLGDYLTTINNIECVVEIYFDKKKQEINELKCLNYNRYKVYNYTLANYSDSIKKYNIEIPLER